MKRLLDTTRPIGGPWTYTQPETGVTLTENHWNAFLKKVRKHREAVGIDTIKGGWIEQLEHDICVANPHLPQEEIGEVARYYTKDDIVRFISTMRELNKSGELVSEDEQRRRIDICVKCLKKGVISGGCRFCSWIAEQTTQLLGGRKIPRVEEVTGNSCMACGCDITSKTAVPLSVLKAVDEKLGESPDYATGCWMRESDFDAVRVGG